MKKQFFRVKQLADQTFLRADKSEVLNNEELQMADHKIEYLQKALGSIIKRIPHAGQNNDVEKRIKKSTEYHLSVAFREHSPRKSEQGEPSDVPESLFPKIIAKCGDVEEGLAKEYAEYEKQVEDLVSAPIQAMLDSDFHNVAKQKRNLSKHILDKDAASSRYNATKKEALKDDMDEADYKVEQRRDALAFEMFTLLAKENEITGQMLQILKCQRGYHECALKRLQDIIPELEKQIGDSNMKPVYGTPLHEHLRVTGKRLALPLEICIYFLHRNGLEEEGLLRIVGSASRVKRLKASIDSGCFFTKQAPDYLDVHVLSSTLKLYLRELPEPLLTSRLHNEWLQAMQRPEHERLDVVKALMARLPTENRENLAFLIQFLAEVARYPQNKMSPSNIAIVIAPNLLWDNEVMNMGSCAAVNMLVELCIKEVATLFPDDMGKLITLPFPDDYGFINTKVEFNVSSENVYVADSPKPNSRKKKTPAPGPPPPLSNNLQTKTDQDFFRNERNLSASYPSGSSTLNRPQKPKEPKTKTTVGVNTEDRRTVTPRDETVTHKTDTNPTKPPSLVNLDNSKTVAHKVITEPALPVQLSKAKPVQQVIAQNAACDNKTFKTTASHPVDDGGVSAPTPAATPLSQRPVAAPRSIDAAPGGVTRSSSIKIELKRQDGGEVQMRRPEVVAAAKPEVPARPASLQKRPSVDLDLHRTQCSLYSVANKQQPSYVNVQNRNEKFQPGHDNQIAEKEKFLGHPQAAKTIITDVNSNNNPVGQLINLPNHSGLPPKAIRPMDLRDTSKSNENLGDIGERVNGNPKTSHVRTRSDGNLIDLSDNGCLVQTPPSPRSLSKPTEPPPPPPVKKEPDSTDL